jgi:MFS family permease
MSSQFDLLKTRRFAPFFATQFFGAFNDNLFKNALIVLLTFQAASWTTMTPEVLTNLAAGIFIVPFFLFSATAGQLADKYDKAKLARLVKLLEIIIMGVALLGFSNHSLPVLLVALFLLGLHSTLFGPVKYAILPQSLREDELVGGNALVEAGTFVAILVGTLAGGLLAGAAGHPTWVAYAGLIVALLGYLCSRSIPPAPAPAPELVVSLNPFSETWRNIGFARQNRTVFLSILGISWFWLYGATLLAQFPVYASERAWRQRGACSRCCWWCSRSASAPARWLRAAVRRACRNRSGALSARIGLTLFGIDLASPHPTCCRSAHDCTLGGLLASAAHWRLLRHRADRHRSGVLTSCRCMR